MNILSATLQILQPVLTLILAIAALWYATETRRLRLQNTEQLDLLKKQIRLSVAPSLKASLSLGESARLLQEILKKKEMKEESKEDLRKQIEKTPNDFSGNVVNSNPNSAYDVAIFIYDSEYKYFLEPQEHKRVIAELTNKHGASFIMSKTNLTKEQVMDKIKSLYGRKFDIKSVQEHLSTGVISYIALVFIDLEDRIHFTKRGFEVNKQGQVCYRKTQRIL